MSIPHRIKVNLSQQEIEVEGSAEFVAKYATEIGALIKGLANGPRIGGDSPSTPRLGEGAALKPPSNLPADELPEAFGEYFFSVPKDTIERDLILVAGNYAQSKNPNNLFTTREASNLLLEQGVRIGNPSECVSRNITAKYLIKMSQGKYRVSRIGLDHLSSILGETT